MRCPVVFKFRRDYTNKNCTMSGATTVPIMAIQNFDFKRKSSRFRDWFVDDNLTVKFVEV